MAEVELEDRILDNNASLKTVSLALEEVNDNPDELIDLRGEGRYFGANDKPIGPRCRNCHKLGHIAAQCKTVVCLACGAVDDHYSEQCPKSITCTNCGDKGHYKNACKKQQKRIYCGRCSSAKHNTERCPLIWRSYITTETKQKKKMPYPFQYIYCYNCANKGHYGDDCPKPRSSRIPNFDGSAFAGENLPRALREQYWSYFRKRKHELDSDEQDGDFGNGNFFKIDYNKVNKEEASEPRFEKKKKSKKDRHKLRKQLNEQNKKRKTGGGDDAVDSTNFRRGNTESSYAGSGFNNGPDRNNEYRQNNKRDFHDRNNANRTKNNRASNNRNNQLQPKRSGYIPKTNEYRGGYFPKANSQNKNGGNYKVPSSNFNFNIPKPSRTGVTLPPGNSSSINPSRTGTLKKNNKSNNYNRKDYNNYPNNRY